MQLEYAVRPSVPSDPFGRTAIAKTPGATRERATLTWGAKATLPDISGAVQTACCKEELDELDRETETVRIFQNNDSSSDNWVDVERAKKLHLSKTEQKTCNPTDVAGQGGFAPTDFTISGFEPSDFSPTANTAVQQCKATWILKNNTSGA